MRIIAGEARGVPLEPPGDRSIRPTLDRVREALFSILFQRIVGGHFLDLFAGTGANGIEALSRGAATATFVDNDPQSLALIRRNLARARTSGLAQVMALDLPDGLDKLASHKGLYTIIYIDPPHAFTQMAMLLERIDTLQITAPQALVVLEHAKSELVPESAGHLRRTRQTFYGRTALSFYQG